VTVASSALTDALLDLLRDADIVTGDGDKAAGAGSAGWQGTRTQSAFVPYVVLYPIEGGRTYGPLSDNTDADSLYQVTGVGSTRRQAELVADAARAALDGSHPDIDGRSVMLVTVDMLGGARRDDTVQPAVWITTDRFRVMSTPAPSGS
jgi:L-alanine-DL-glutamate epimerase-like enolase superfamily enzyme